MSWFSLSMQGKEIVDMHSTFSQFYTGSYLSKKIFESFVRHNTLNVTVRNAAADKLNEMVAPQLNPVCKQAAEKIINASLNTKKLAYVTVKLKDQVLQSPGENFIGITKHSARLAMYAAKKLVTTIPNPFVKTEDPLPTPPQPLKTIPLKANYGQEERAAVLALLQKGEISEAIKLHTLYTLLPTCEQAVQKGMESVTKAAAGKAYDSVVKKVCDVVVMPIAYAVTFTALDALGSYFEVPCTSILQSLPSSSTMLAMSTANHAIQMTAAVWSEFRKETDKTDSDKEEVKRVALMHAKVSMSKKVMENELLSYLGVTQSEEDIDRIVNTLVCEIVDFYWDDLHETKILGLPLVT